MTDNMKRILESATLINSEFVNISTKWGKTEFSVDEMLQPKIDEQLEKVVSELENDFTDRIKTKVEKRMKTLINKIDINVLVGEK